MQLDLKDENISYALLKKQGASFKNLLSHNLNKYYHPASLLKLFTGVIFEERFLAEDKRLDEAHLASIKDSDNDALAFILDFIAPLKADYNFLSETDLDQAVTRRKVINNFFSELNFSTEMNISNKCFGFDYYGKEAQLLERLGPNQITCQDLIDLLILIEAKYPKTFQAMHRELFPKRDSANLVPSSIIDTEDYQIEAFSGKVLREQLNLKEIYSKAAWTSKVRHDSVLFDVGEGAAFPSGRYLLALMTQGFSHSPETLQQITELVIKEFLI